jgi:hypothetical protein
MRRQESRKIEAGNLDGRPPFFYPNLRAAASPETKKEANYENKEIQKNS